jgi:hypothetical protein
LATPPPVRNQDSSCTVSVSPSSTPSRVTAQQQHVQQAVRGDAAAQRQHSGSEQVGSTLACAAPVRAWLLAGLTNGSMRGLRGQVGITALVGADVLQRVRPLHRAPASPTASLLLLGAARRGAGGPSLLSLLLSVTMVMPLML